MIFIIILFWKKLKREDVDVLFTDTDSLCYSIRKQNIFEIIKENKDEFFDLSDFPKDHELYDPKNKKVQGKFKIDCTDIIKEFVGLRAKLYSFITEKDEETKKCKGVKKHIVKQKLTIADYKNTLETRESKNIEQNCIRSYYHQLYTEKVDKIALSCTDDKVYVCSNNINTYNFGHKNIKIASLFDQLPF